MSVHQEVSSILRLAEEQILLAVQNDGTDWNSVYDEDGNPYVPDTEREVLVFLCGNLERTDKRPEDAGYGLRQGYFDEDKRCWRVQGSFNRYVTHWRECPPDPKRI